MIAINFDPIARGYVASLARPGGNITGVVFQQLELAQKQVEVLAQADRRPSFVGQAQLTVNEGDRVIHRQLVVAPGRVFTVEFSSLG